MFSVNHEMHKVAVSWNFCYVYRSLYLLGLFEYSAGDELEKFMCEYLAVFLSDE